ncbi:MAG: adenosylcobinamide-GDP ribazoletransferase [Proteobacteria bacterium]|jgi:adenosylcobinamide-GDP ribazoletransferase|nr:adenosylcobinamide-GDP ribazoletransferase [Pseudomonadota bacterium]MBT5793377.1 adenosylcobinamide-GDP ribazoletransferase [Deltaproteobacteria bacterium]
MENKLVREMRRIAGAFIFYSRIPLPANWYLAKTSHGSRYFSLVGWLAGGVSVGVWLLAQMLFVDLSWTFPEMTLPIAVLLGMIAAVLLTGALHEDGFADTCDGLGGGWTPEERLRIMKDSRIGTYGALGLVFLILLKFFALLQIETEILPLVWFAGHALSRFASISQLHFLTYVQDAEKSKSGTMTEFSGIDLIVNAAFGLLPLIFIGYQVWVALLAVVIVWWVLIMLFKRKLGGVTGDSLGATQQFCEVVFYLGLTANLGV